MSAGKGKAAMIAEAELANQIFRCWMRRKSRDAGDTYNRDMIHAFNERSLGETLVEHSTDTPRTLSLCNAKAMPTMPVKFLTSV